MAPFNFYVDNEHVKREKHQARLLRATQWWKRKIAKGICHYCKKTVSPKDLTMDHIVPISRGGLSTKGNVVPCCKACNTKKKQLLPMEWDEYLKKT
ncbi:MAG: HNH endonuclease [Desulfobacterales bacterium]